MAPGRRFVSLSLIFASIVSLNGEILTAQNVLYQPLPLPLNQKQTDSLSVQDIPTGEGGFAKDYRIELNAGDHVAIEVESNEFDPLIQLIADDGSTVAANDDSPEGGTNSLLFARLREGGAYIVRVRTFGIGGGGRYSLQVNRLKPEK